MSSMLYFAVAAVAAFILYYCFPIKIRWIALLIASVAFYAVMSTYLFAFAIATAIGVYFAARTIERLNNSAEHTEQNYKKRVKRLNKAITVVTIVFNLAVLGFLKYYDFLGNSVCSFLALCGAKIEFSPLNLLLPLGISFYTLTAIGYLVDVYRKKYPAERNFFKILLFLTFFGTVTEGPILRYDGGGGNCSKDTAPNTNKYATGYSVYFGEFLKNS